MAHALLAAGEEVVVVGRDAQRLQAFVDKGARAAVGNLEDADFLAQTFRGATAVYAVIPPKWDLQEPWRTYQDRISEATATALEKANVAHAVVLSSNGAHLPSGAGPVSGLHAFEQRLQKVKNLHVMSLRAGFFMQNLYAHIGLIKAMNMFGYALHADVRMPLVHTDDIAQVAAHHLRRRQFEGFSHVFVPGPRDLTMPEIAAVLGRAIEKPDLRYVVFSPEQSRAGMMQAGVPETIADGYNELFNSLNKGDYLSDYHRTPENNTPTSIEDFAHEFAAVYRQE